MSLVGKDVMSVWLNPIFIKKWSAFFYVISGDVV